MAKGYDQHNARKQMTAALGKELSRRAKSKCELCGQNRALGVVEVPPIPNEPDPDAAVLICSRCKSAIEAKKINTNDSFQFLNEAVWSEEVPVQIVAVRLTKRLADSGESWAIALLEGLYLDPEVEERL